MAIEGSFCRCRNGSPVAGSRVRGGPTLTMLPSPRTMLTLGSTIRGRGGGAVCPAAPAARPPVRIRKARLVRNNPGSNVRLALNTLQAQAARVETRSIGPLRVWRAGEAPSPSIAGRSRRPSCRVVSCVFCRAQRRARGAFFAGPEPTHYQTGIRTPQGICEENHTWRPSHKKSDGRVRFNTRRIPCMLRMIGR